MKKVFKVRVTWEVINSLFVSDSIMTVKVLKGIPKDSVLFHLENNPDNRCVDYYFYSKCGEDIKEGECLTNLPSENIIISNMSDIFCEKCNELLFKIKYDRKPVRINR